MFALIAKLISLQFMCVLVLWSPHCDLLFHEAVYESGDFCELEYKALPPKHLCVSNTAHNFTKLILVWVKIISFLYLIIPIARLFKTYVGTLCTLSDLFCTINIGSRRYCPHFPNESKSLSTNKVLQSQL